jgi:hypothetical protein
MLHTWTVISDYLFIAVKHIRFTNPTLHATCFSHPQLPSGIKINNLKFKGTYHTPRRTVSQLKNTHFELCPQEVCLRQYLPSGIVSHIYFLKWSWEGRSVILLMRLHHPDQWFFLYPKKLYFSSCASVLLGMRYVKSILQFERSQIFYNCHTYLLTYSFHGAGSFLRSWLTLNPSRNFPCSMEPEGSLPNLQMLATWPYLKLTNVLTLDFYRFFIPCISFCFVTKQHCILLLGLLEAFKNNFM